MEEKKIPEENIVYAPTLEATKSLTAGQVENIDESATFLLDNHITEEYLAELVNDKQKNKRLVRKIDLIVLPLLAGTYVLQYIDKQALSYAAVFDLFESTGTTQSQYSWFASMFYLAYVREEQPFRAGIFYSCNGIGSMLGGIFSYGVGQIDSFPVWKAVFLLCGGVTVLWGCVLLFCLPDSILSARWFSLEERALLVGRGRLARTGILNKTIQWYQIREAFGDPQVWLLTIFVLLNEVINGGMSNFGKLIIKGLVTDPLLTTALGIPQGAFQVFWILTGTLTATKFRNHRTTVMILWLVPTIIGTCLIWKLDRTRFKVGVLFGYYLVGSFVASLVLALQMPATNLGGYTKRITASAIVFTAYCVGNIIGPHAFLADEAPLYPTGCKVILSCAVGQMLTGACLRLLLKYRGKKRERWSANHDASLEESDIADIDRTDFEKPSFRYVL
ncbi:hypothetical protein LEMA_P028740.1 [Plenodomus lingam JN3]|uniref:MFS transporter n=1 Tax=Leptosphaeria maculans (strain JN3 / isolate v23.1.3 / race Av1-4-5-6-7-8) TaxID=985895 RepID=E4ZVU6_LEPMJ|nr:hypothetical protein LEMA_P028740.1 [Plenodomus lingam JN3]CBX95722.1 hypothetical protein LEMA_P028740.1 [Plenodomus lingam JN3]